MKSRIMFLGTLAICSVVFFSVTVKGQSGEIRNGRILTVEGKRILFRNLTIGETSHRYQTSAGMYQEIPADNTVRIEKRTGSEAGKWALVMGLAGLGGSILGVTQARQSNNGFGDSKNVNYTPIVVGLTGLSALIGAVAGATMKKYKTVHSNARYNSSSYHVRFNLDVGFASNWKYASVRYRF